LNKSTVSVVIVALMIGLAFGILVFPRTITLTSTQTTTTTKIITYQVTLSYRGIVSTTGEYPLVTLTAIIVDVYYYEPECTTISGTPIVTYTNGPGGQLTKVVTVYNATLPQQYLATVTTDYTSFSASETTFPYTGPC
jgi:hypothetical protein